MNNLSKRELAKRIKKLIDIYANETCNVNELWKADFAKELWKLDIYKIEDFHRVLGLAVALNSLKERREY